MSTRPGARLVRAYERTMLVCARRGAAEAARTRRLQPADGCVSRTYVPKALRRPRSAISTPLPSPVRAEGEAQRGYQEDEPRHGLDDHDRVSQPEALAGWPPRARVGGVERGFHDPHAPRADPARLRIT